ncbi:MAG: hypothetical protein WCE64_11275 [Bacteroidales bacterium]
MNLSDFIKSNGKRISMEHCIRLVQVSQADGKIAPAEHELLQKEGRKFGLTDPEIEMIIEREAKHHYDPPYSLADKFEQLYNIAEMILADEIVTEGEKKLLRRFAIEAGFGDKAIEGLIDLLLNGIANGEDEDKLFREFREKHLFRD